MSLEWFGDRQKTRLLALAKKRSEAGAKVAARIIRDEISVPGPEASAPGEYPHRQSGELMAGVRAVEEGKYWSVVSDSEHAEEVEHLRPYFRRAIRENIAAINNAVQGGR